MFTLPHSLHIISAAVPKWMWQNGGDNTKTGSDNKQALKNFTLMTVLQYSVLQYSVLQLEKQTFHSASRYCRLSPKIGLGIGFSHKRYVIFSTRGIIKVKQQDRGWRGEGGGRGGGEEGCHVFSISWRQMKHIALQSWWFFLSENNAGFAIWILFFVSFKVIFLFFQTSRSFFTW